MSIQKEKIYEKVLNYLNKEFPEYRIKDLIGLDKENKSFNASLGTYHDLKNER